MQPEDPTERIARLLGALDPLDGSDEALDANDVARYAAGRPDDEVRAAIEARMGTEDARVAGVVAAAAAARDRPTIRWRPLLAIAASLAVVLGGWLLLAGRTSQHLTDEDLGRAFAALAEAEPEAFGDLAPLLTLTTEPGGASTRRGGLEVMEPAGTLLELRPALRWEAVRGAETYKVEVVSDEGEAVLAVASADAQLSWPAEAPPLEAGSTYLLRVSTAAAGIRVEASRAFRVAGLAERTRYERLLAAIDRTVPAELRAVVRAQVALGFDIVSEAERHLSEPVPPEASALAEKTKTHLRQAQGPR